MPNRIPRVPDSFSENESWTDPLIGVRARYQFDPQWSVTGYADYGGFGIGSESTWQVFATLNYRISERWSASAGYRALAFDYDPDDFALDTTLGGAVFGATYRF